jgi:hypothetical protein
VLKSKISKTAKLFSKIKIPIYLTGVHVIGVCLMGVHLMGVHLMGVHLMSMCLMGVYLINVHLAGVHLMGVCLIGVYFTGMHLISMYLTGMYLMGMNLINVRLTGVYLMGMHLMSAHLIGVYLMCTSRKCSIQSKRCCCPLKICANKDLGSQTGRQHHRYRSRSFSKPPKKVPAKRLEDCATPLFRWTWRIDASNVGTP